jgi:hypothetical protein
MAGRKLKFILGCGAVNRTELYQDQFVSFVNKVMNLPSNFFIRIMKKEMIIKYCLYH